MSFPEPSVRQGTENQATQATHPANYFFLQPITCSRMAPRMCYCVGTALMPGRWDSPPGGFWSFPAAVSETFPSPKTFLTRTMKVWVPLLSYKRELVKTDQGQVWRDRRGLKMGWGKEVTQGIPQGPN